MCVACINVPFVCYCSVYVIANTIVLMTTPGGLVVECSPGVQEVVGSIPGHVIPKTSKMVFDASLRSAQNLTDRSRTYGRFPHCQL